MSKTADALKTAKRGVESEPVLSPGDKLVVAQMLALAIWVIESAEERNR